MRGVAISPQRKETNNNKKEINKKKNLTKVNPLSIQGAKARCCRVLISVVLKYQGNMINDV